MSLDHVATYGLNILRKAKRDLSPFRECMSASDYWTVSKSRPFTGGETQLLGKPLHYSDKDGLFHSIDEIFYEHFYKFAADTDAPFIVDAGANIGLSVIYFKQLYPACRILAFEPDAAIFEILTKNVVARGLTDVEVRNAAVWTEDTTLTFFSEGSLAGSTETDFLSKRQATTVPAERLKPILQKQPVDFLKIDIEGAENKVLFDIEPELGHVGKLFFEYHSLPGQSQRLGDLLNVVSRAGFSYVINGARGPAHPFVERPSHGFDLQLNIYCFRK